MDKHRRYTGERLYDKDEDKWYYYDSDDYEYYPEPPISGSTGGGFTRQTDKNRDNGWGCSGCLITILGTCLFLYLSATCLNKLTLFIRRANESRLEKRINETKVSETIKTTNPKTPYNLNRKREIISSPKSKIVPNQKCKPIPKANLKEETIPYVEPEKINTDTNKIVYETNKINPDINEIEFKSRIEVYQIERNKIDHKIEQDTRNIPFIVTITDEKGKILERRQEYSSRRELESRFVSELTVAFPSGKKYKIKEEEYPEIYKKFDLNGDGKISEFELSEANKHFDEIVKRLKEGDMKSLVEEYIKKY